MLRRSGFVVLSLACLCAQLPGVVQPGPDKPGSGLSALSTTPWDVRRDAEELFADLGRTGRDGAVLVERAQQLLAKHGTELIVDGETLATIAEAVPRRLRASGLSDLFVRTYGGAAERRLVDAQRLPQSERLAALRDVANDYPGTPAAQRAWQRLADLAWDRGRLGSYLAAAQLAGDAEHATRGARLAQAKNLGSQRRVPRLPETLTAVDEPTWATAVDAAAQARPMSPRFRRPADDKPPPPPRLCLSDPLGELLAAADGLRLIVVDHLLGAPVARPIGLGNTLLYPRQCRPVSFADGFAAVGVRDQVPVLVCADRSGQVRWSRSLIQARGLAAPSAPVLCEGRIVLALTHQDENGIGVLRVLGFDALTGTPRFDTAVARLVRDDFRFGDPAVPALAVQGGQLIALSNAGVLAQLDSEGRTQRLWTYPTTSPRFDDAPRVRHGSLLCSGDAAVATPSDNPSLLLVLDPGAAAPRSYTGDGSSDEVIAVGEGAALCAGKGITLLDLGSLSPRWTQRTSLTQPQGFLGDRRVLIAGSSGAQTQFHLLDRKDGSPIGIARFVAANADIVVHEQMLLLGTADRLEARGGSQELIARLEAELRQSPGDRRVLSTLASLAEARGDAATAIGFLMRALAHGSSSELAERAASLLRRDLDRSCGDAAAFAPVIAQFLHLVPHDPQASAEAAYWRGRHAEAGGEGTSGSAAEASAAAYYRSALAAPPRLLRLRDRLRVDLRLLVRAGLARCGAAPSPFTVPAATSAAQAAALPASTSWVASCRRTGALLLGGGMAVGFCDGVLTGQRLHDGSEAWFRSGQRAMLGVQMVMEQRPGRDGIPVNVLPGGAASRIGLQNGDVLLSLNGKPTRDFTRDLRQVVEKMSARDAFVLEVERGDQRLRFEGRLGSDVVEPCAIGTRTVIARALRLPERVQDNQAFIIDLATGRELWIKQLTPATPDLRDPPGILLTQSDLVIAVDGPDIAAWPAHGAIAAPAQAPEEAWRLPGLGSAFASARLIGGLLWMTSQGSGILIDPDEGSIIAELPAESDREPRIDGQTVVLIGGDGRLTRFDLGLGRQAWRSSSIYGDVLALRGDALLAVDRAWRPSLLDRASGAVRRTLGDAVLAPRVAEAGNGDLLAIAVRGASKTLQRIDPASGTTRMSVHLPPGAEVVGLAAGSTLSACLLREPSGRSDLLVIDHAGGIRFAQSLGRDAGEPALHVQGDTVLLSTPQTLRALSISSASSAVLAAPPPVPLPVLAVRGAQLDELAAAALPRLQWQACGATRFALAATGSDLGSDLLVFGEISDAAPMLTVRLGDAGPAIEPVDQAVEFNFILGTPPVLRVGPGDGTDPVPGGWRQVGAKRLADSADGKAIFVARLTAMPDRAPLGRVVVAAHQPDLAPDERADQAPWWLRARWRPLVPAP